MKSATSAAIRVKNTAANQDIPILVENAWNHRLQNVQMLPRYQIQTGYINCLMEPHQLNMKMCKMPN